MRTRSFGAADVSDSAERGAVCGTLEISGPAFGWKHGLELSPAARCFTATWSASDGSGILRDSATEDSVTTRCGQ